MISLRLLALSLIWNMGKYVIPMTFEEMFADLLFLCYICNAFVC